MWDSYFHGETYNSVCWGTKPLFFFLNRGGLKYYVQVFLKTCIYKYFDKMKVFFKYVYVGPSDEDVYLE